MYSLSTYMITPSHVTELCLISPLGGANGFFLTQNFSETAGRGTRSWLPWTQIYSPYKPAKPGQDIWCNLGSGHPNEIFENFDLIFF